ncbi:pyridoxine/pyridoxamine 5'-phosphate oxidase [Nocardiopsis suaedae]|uniref:Pyridoxal 5'-phosphate synthase n=1 Tax=Nocardiopsis suaedae TaxID=3018444 RepID=A0ABT4TUH7_9ACTN|nr:pyridoxal 5'-phosphate synthase [Nocardiopsis suaedae]MDA2808364.1 pyridoxal 5'-phosphate synthase [Nocardiopsis suaedae]
MAPARGNGIRRLLRDLPVFDGAVPPFEPASAPDEPLELFEEWLQQAVEAGVREPHAAAVATADAGGSPSVRVLILKDADERGFSFATSSTSRKGRELAERPEAAMVFHWREQARQIRLRGPVLIGTPEENAADFRERSLEGRAAGMHGLQSSPLNDLDEVARAFEDGISALEADPGAVPSSWALYRLVPMEAEFWQGHPKRLHTRLRYTRPSVDDAWKRELLWP